MLTWLLFHGGQSAETILDGAETEDVAFLVVGDPFGLVSGYSMWFVGGPGFEFVIPLVAV